MSLAALRAEHPGHNSSTEDITIVGNAGINDTSEYIAGHADDPSYEQVCTGLITLCSKMLVW